MARYFQDARLRAAGQALLVTFLWSTSFVLIKIGLRDLPALTFAGLRYGLASLCLLPFALRGRRRAALATASARDWGRLVLLGLVYYAVTQGTQFLGLAYLPAVTVSLILSFTPVFVLGLAALTLGEAPGRMQWLGVLLSMAGVALYFYPIALPAGQALGLVIMLACVLGNALSALLGRSVNRRRTFDPLTVTFVSMAVGSVVMLAAGIAGSGLPRLALREWAIVAWLAVVSTAVAFTLWNHTLVTLSAVESSVINNTMLLQIALLAWVFLNEAISLRQGLGLLVVLAGTLMVQLLPGRPAPAAASAAVPIPPAEEIG